MFFLPKLRPAKAGLFCLKPTNLANEVLAIRRIPTVIKMESVQMEHVREICRDRLKIVVANRGADIGLLLSYTSSPLASFIKRQDTMNNDFTRVPLMNAMTTRANFRRKSLKGPAVLLMVLGSAVTYVTLVD